MAADGGAGRGLLSAAAASLGDTVAYWAILAFGVFVLFVTSWIPAARTLRELNARERSVQAEIDALKRENAKLENRLNGLYSDPYYVERVLRQELGFLPQGEKVLKGAKKD
ncbi:MAG: septum formation initiator family protein [Planctomycetes bacterium]|jgi:cell division protein FtsB|nr:septum formation initiator family protein [Planctomycetota bacterium]